MVTQRGSDIIKAWPEESQEAAQLVIDTYGEPHEATESLLTWHDVGPWKRVLAAKVFLEHQFPAPHFDSVESVIDLPGAARVLHPAGAVRRQRHRRAHRRGGVGPLP